MSYTFDTRLVCKSNKKLLHEIDPSKIIKDRNSKFISSRKGAYHYFTRNGTMHDSIVALSNEYPTEIFVAQFWSVDIDCSIVETYKYINGFSKCIKVEPNYMYCVSHIEDIMGKKTLKRFMKVALKHIKKIDELEAFLTNEKKGLKSKHNILSSITINVEDKDYKIEAYEVGSSFLEVNGYIKINEDSGPRWQLIEREKNKVVKESHQLDGRADESKEEMYEPLPF